MPTESDPIHRSIWDVNNNKQPETLMVGGKRRIKRYIPVTHKSSHSMTDRPGNYGHFIGKNYENNQRHSAEHNET